MCEHSGLWRGQDCSRVMSDIPAGDTHCLRVEPDEVPVVAMRNEFSYSQHPRESDSQDKRKIELSFQSID